MQTRTSVGRRFLVLGVVILSLLGAVVASPAGAGGSDTPVGSATVDRGRAPRVPAEIWSDSFQGAGLRRGAPLWYAINTTGGTSQRCEPRHAGVRGGRSQWIRWLSTGAGPVVLTTRGSEFDTLLAVYTGTDLCHLTEVASDDDSGPGTTSQLRFTSRLNQVYRIVIDGKLGRQGYGNFRLSRP